MAEGGYALSLSGPGLCHDGRGEAAIMAGAASITVVM